MMMMMRMRMMMMMRMMMVALQSINGVIRKKARSLSDLKQQHVL